MGTLAEVLSNPLGVVEWFVYLLAAVLFVVGLHMMNSPKTARKGNLISAAGMVMAVAMAFIVLFVNEISNGFQHGVAVALLIVGIIIAVLVVALAAGFGVWWFMLRDSGTQSAQTQSTSQQSGKTKSGDSKAAKDDKPCTAAPDAELSSVDHSDANLVAQLQLTSNCASTKDGDTAEFKESDVKVSIKDDDGNVIASAVFDFSKQPVKFNGETANVALEFTTRQYWRPYDQIETGSAEVILQTGQSGTGEAGSADGDALAGSDIDSEDAERYAQLALSWQLKHDESAASRFYTTYTTQLSSKKNDMKADGKTWHYVDIYEQFLQQRIKHKNAILIWSGDYPTYTKADASTAYYVILSGDTVDSVKAGDAWCKSNGYGAADCAVVDLQ